MGNRIEMDEIYHVVQSPESTAAMDRLARESRRPDERDHQYRSEEFTLAVLEMTDQFLLAYNPIID